MNKAGNNVCGIKVFLLAFAFKFSALAFEKFIPGLKKHQRILIKESS
jgi:hypothetical protein